MGQETIMNPESLYYSKEHEWVSLEGDIATVGITDHAQGELGDIVFVELPDKGVSLNAGTELGTVESVKAVSEIYAPVDGEVVEVNEALRDEPETVNREPYGAGWMLRVRLSDPKQVDELMNAAAYRSYVEGESPS